MKLGTRGRYAVMAMVDLAKFSSNGPVSLAAIAERQELSLSYLEQLFNKLRKVGLVKSVRGPTGGYTLSLDSSAICIADIIIATDEPLKAVRCDPTKNSLGCLQSKSKCMVHDLWEELGNQILFYLKSISLKDVLEGHIVKSSSCLPSDGEKVFSQRMMQ